MRTRHSYLLPGWLILCLTFSSAGGQDQIPNKTTKIHPSTAPYRYTSLKQYSNEQIFAFMSDGVAADEIELQRKTFTIPESIWNVDSKQAARRIAESLWEKEAGARPYRFVIKEGIDDAPSSLSIMISARGAHWTRWPSYYLKVDPNESYFAYSASSCPPYWEEYDRLMFIPAYEFRVHAVNYRMAKHVADILWWLKHGYVPEPPPEEDHLAFFNTGGGVVTLQLVAAGGRIPISITADLNAMLKRTPGYYGDDAYIQIAWELVTEMLAKQIGESRQIVEEDEDGFTSNIPQLEILRDQTVHFLQWFSLDQMYVSYNIVEDAVDAAGDLALANAVPELTRILNEVSSIRSNNERCEEQINAEIEDLKSKASSFDLWDKTSVLYNEADAVRHGVRMACSADILKRRAELALRKIENRDNAVVLQQWISNREEGWKWALWRLQKIDQQRFASALSQLFETETDSAVKAQILYYLSRADDTLAQRYASLNSFEVDARLIITAFSVLSQLQPMPEESKWLSAILAIMTNRSIDGFVRQAAIQAVMPEGNANRFSDERINSTLLTVLREQPADYSEISPVPEAARVLYHRSSLKYFDSLLEAFDSRGMDDFGSIVEVLESTTSDLDRTHRSNVAHTMRMQFTETLGSVDSLALSIWTLNLKNLKRELEHLATSGPQELEAEDCKSWTNHPRKLQARCHSARRIVSLWNEEDAVTRLKLLLSFYASEPYSFNDSHSDTNKARLERLKEDLHQTLRMLTKSQRAELGEFLDWMNQNHPFAGYDRKYAQQRQQLFQFVEQTRTQ